MTGAMQEKKTFNKVLARCLEELERGDDIEAIVQRYPEHQAELRPLLAMACATIETLADVPEPPYELARGRERVLRAAEARRAWMRPPAPETHGRPRFRLRWPRLSFDLDWAWKLAGVALAMIMLLVPLSGHIVWAASESLPHNPLYPLKVTVENQHFKHIDDPEVQVVIAMALTEERIKELQILVERNQTIPSSVVDRTGQLSALALNAAAWTPEPLMADMLNFIIRRTRAQANALEVLKAQTNGHNHTELNKTQRSCLLVERVASMALEYPESFRAAYQAGQPEKMRYTEGGPLGGIITDAVLESITPEEVPEEMPEAIPEELPGKRDETPTIPTNEPPLIPTATPSPTTTPPAPAPTATAVSDTTPSETNSAESDIPPGQDVRPDTPPGQEDTPAQPPGQDNRPTDPPNQETPGENN